MKATVSGKVSAAPGKKYLAQIKLTARKQKSKRRKQETNHKTELTALIQRAILWLGWYTFRPPSGTLFDRPLHWTARAFHGYISEVYRINCSYQTAVRFFHRQGFALKIPQPWSDRQDEAQREAFRQRLKQLGRDPESSSGLPTCLPQAGESGFEGRPGQDGPRRCWDRKGKKTRSTKNGDHLRINVMGMVCPRTGEFFAIEVSHSDSQTFQAFLNEAGKFIHLQRPRSILILDNVSWHKRQSTNWQGWEPMYLPPYSPDLNPIERIWLVMKAQWFNNYICRNVDQLCHRSG